MMVHARVQELISLYAIGSLDESQRTDVEKHLRAGCPSCRSELEKLEDAAAELALLTCRVEPPQRTGLRVKKHARDDAASHFVECRDERRPDHKFYESLVPFYALGSLSETSRTALEEHLAAGCGFCGALLADQERVAAELASATSRLQPPSAIAERLKQRVLSHVDTRGVVSDAVVRCQSPAASKRLIGREEEMVILRARFDELKRGEGSMVSIEGEAGLGKTRLVEEALREQNPDGADVFTGHCVAAEGRITYEPFVEVLRAWAGVTGENDAAFQRDAIETMIVNALGEEEARDVFPVVARMLGLDPGSAHRSTIAGIEGAALERRIHEVLKALFAARSKRRPVVLIIEDLHWADSATVSLLESLLPLVETHALLVVAVLRPGNAQTSDRIVAFADRSFRLRHHRLRLQRLDRRQTRRLVRDLFDVEELPREVIRVVERKGEGNPFFVEEIARTLVDSGAVADSGEGRLRVSSQLSSLDGYGTLGQLVMSRVSRLDPHTRRVLETASVVGQSVYRRVLESMLGEGTDVDGAIDKLQAARLLKPMSSRQTANRKVRTLSLETGFTFEHALTQETVLGSLDVDRRRGLHAACAEAIEAVYSNRLQDFHAVLAYQYTRAQRWEKANEYLLKAGESAAASAASADALYFFREGYRVYRLIHGTGGDKETQARLERDIALALLNVGDLSECIEHFNASLRLYGEWVPRSGWSMRVKFLIDLPAVVSGLYLGSFAKAKRACSDRDRALFELMYNRCRAQNIVDDERRTFDNVAAIRHVGHLDPASVENATGILASAGAFFAFSGLSFGPSERFLAIAEHLAERGNRSDRFLYQTMAFVVRFFEGDWSRRHDIDSEDFEYGLRRGLLWDADVYLGMNCERNIHQGEYEMAERQIEMCGQLCDRWGYEFARSNELGTRAHLLVAQRRLAEARDAATCWCEVRDEDQIQLLAFSLLAKIESLDDNPAAAAEALARAETIRMRGSGLNFPFYSGAYLTSRLRLDLRELEEAVRSGEKSSTRDTRRVRRDCRRAIASARKIARDRAEALRLAARLHWLWGEPAKAFRFWEQALEAGQRLGERAEFARCCRDLWRSLADAEDGARLFRGVDAEGWLGRAREGFALLGADYELAELEELKSKVRAA